MAFPETNLPLKVHLSLDGSTWTDVSADVRYEGKIRIVRGRADWGQQVDFGRCTFSLSNTDGKYSPRNPEGTYYGQIGRNTPVRVSVETGSVALDLPGAEGDYASTPDVAALDITGDLDVRFDATLANWCLADYPTGTGTDYDHTELMGKAASGQVSWNLYVRLSKLYLTWSTNGSTLISASSTADLPLTTSGRLAVRATLDVNNGAGGHVVTFYTSDSISGAWTQLGDAVTGSGTTSIHSGTAALRIGSIPDVSYSEAIGLVHAAQIRNGIGGTVVANPDFTAQSSGTTSFADSAGLTWTTAGNAEITNRKTRFVGEVSSWTPRWDTGGFDVVTQVEAAGILRRLGLGAVPLKSPMYREATSPLRTAIVAYWPMEDGSDATEFGSAVDGHPAFKLTGSVTPSAYSDWVGSDAIPTVGTGSMRVSIPTYGDGGSNSTNQLFFFAKVPAAGVVSTQRLVSVSTTGQAATWSLYVNTAGLLDMRAYDSDGTQIHASGFSGTSINGREKLIAIRWGPPVFVEYVVSVTDVAGSKATAVPDNVLDSFTITNTVTATSVVRLSEIRFGEDGAMNGTAIGHVVVGNTSTAFNGFAAPGVGWNAEEAPSRITRLGTEESVHSYATGPGDEQMGVQSRATAVDLMRTAEQVDKGILAEQRALLGIRYVTRASMYSQPAALTLNYTGDDGLVTPLDPVDDDQSVTNDVTEQREGGASARAVLTTGSLSTQAPPNGIGLYDTSYTTNLLDDTQPAQHAAWRLHLGTWDETRFPQVTVNLAGAPASIEAAASVDVGSRIQISNPPVWLPPDTLDLLCQGYSETLDQRSWTITYNCTPYGPFNVATEGDALYNRADTDGCELAEALTTTETAADVLTTSGPVWTTDAAEFPFDVRAAGEVMTVTNCTSAAEDAFGRSVTDGWGTADVGGTWTNEGGAATDFDVNGSAGTHTMTTVNVARRSRLTMPHADFDIYADISTSALATGGPIYAGPMARYTDVNNLYVARVSFTTTQTVVLAIIERVAAVQTTLGTYTTMLTHAAATAYRVRFQGSGTALKAKVWLASDLEPGLWQVEVTDSSLTTATNLGCWSLLDSANTNVNPVISWDNFDLINPQTMTVTRSVNGVTKTHAAGADVRLAYPAYTAL